MELQGARAHPAGLGPVAHSQEMTICLALPREASDDQAIGGGRQGHRISWTPVRALSGECRVEVIADAVDPKIRQLE